MEQNKPSHIVKDLQQDANDILEENRGKVSLQWIWQHFIDYDTKNTITKSKNRQMGLYQN